MRLSIKLISIFLFLLLASSLLVMHGCAGKGSAGCPNDTAPSSATIVSPTLGGTPTNAGGACYPTVIFTIKDSNGNPMNDICVDVFSNGLIALASGPPNCSNVTNLNAIVTRTDNDGNVVVEMVTLPTFTGGTSFVEVDSGSLSGIATTPPTTD